MATDLSSDCDRALDRASMLARRWNACLHVVHAVRDDSLARAWWSPQGSRIDRQEQYLEQVERQVRSDLIDLPPELVVHAEAGDPVEVIVKIAQQEQCDLVVAGTSGPTFASIIMHTTTEQLLRRLQRSLLVVKARPRNPYGDVLVGTDFTPESRLGLETAAAWFGEAAFTVMNALDVPYRSMLLDGSKQEAFDALEREAMDAFVAEARLPEGVRQGLQRRIVYGYPEAMLSEPVLSRQCDLVVLGAVRRGLAFHMLVGGNAARIVQTVPGDVLVVHDPQKAP